MSTMAPAPRRDPAEALTARLLDAAEGFFQSFSVFLGDRLGLYDALAKYGALTSAELADRTGTHERYVREWLEHQAVSGILAVHENGRRRFALPLGHDEVLACRDHLNYLAPLFQLLAGAVRPLDSLLEAFRTGRGIPFQTYGRDLREGQGRMNRVMFLKQLGQEWLAGVPRLRARLDADPPARIADFGCGVGWSAIGIALAYPKVQVDGLDLDAPSIEAARVNAREAGVAGRVRFEARDAGDPALAGRYDLVTALECIHDMSDPVAALRSMRRLLNQGGCAFIADERVAERFSPQADQVERLMYGFSVLHCLPAGMAEQPSAATGTVMRPGMLERYAREAGFSRFEVLPVEHLLFRFYLLRP